MTTILIRLLGDVLHAFAHFVLLQRLLHYKNSQGISIKTQELLLLVCCTRYLHIFFTKVYSWYNSFFKVLLISVHVAAIYLLKKLEPTQETYRREQDDFGHWDKIVMPSLTFGFVIHLAGNGFGDFDHFILLWTFSIILESVALLPQISMYQRRCREFKNLTGGAYIFLIGAYRFFYCIHWVYHAKCEPQRFKYHWLLYFCGAVQVGIALWGLFWPRYSSGVSVNTHADARLKVNHSSHVAVRASSVALFDRDGNNRADVLLIDNGLSIL